MRVDFPLAVVKPGSRQLPGYVTPAARAEPFVLSDSFLSSGSATSCSRHNRVREWAAAPFTGQSQWS